MLPEGVSAMSESHCPRCDGGPFDGRNTCPSCPSCTALQAELDEYKAGLHADETGHLHRCAKVNGVWSCAPGCAKAEVARLTAAHDLRNGGFPVTD